MELIKLPMNLGLMVVKILEQHNIEPRKYTDGSFKGMLSLEFTEEELNLVTELTIVNPTKDCLKGIENLHCLEKIDITTTGITAYKGEPASITDSDIARIAKVTSLKSLRIDNQRNITWAYLDNLSELEVIELTRNAALEEITGLDKLTKVKEFMEYGNKELYEVNGIVDLIKNNALEAIELDVLHYNEVVDPSLGLNQMLNCSFTEDINGGKYVSYNYYQMLLFHRKCLKIAEEAKAFSPDVMQQIIYLENYLAKNISYDYDALNTENRAHLENGSQKGFRNGTNSAYNGIMFGSAVCEGYTRSMQYILKQINVKTKDVYCIGGADKIKINTDYHNQVMLPDDGYHSIIRIERDNSIYYCDPCWDSRRYHRGDTSLPYCLLTKAEMSKTHTMSFEEKIVDFGISYPREYVNSVINRLETSNVDTEGAKAK